jgi:Domain of unknown function (DUF4126)
MTFVLGPDVSGLWVIIGALVLGATCGLRVFVAPFALVLIGALDGLQGPESTPLTVLAAGLALAEMVLDATGWDETLDAAGLALRPLWAVAVVAWQVPLDDALWLGAIAAALALAVGSGKARLRLAAERSLVLRWSLVEDAAAVVLVVAALYSPYVAAVGLLVVLVLIHRGAHRLARLKWGDRDGAGLVGEGGAAPRS